MTEIHSALFDHADIYLAAARVVGYWFAASFVLFGVWCAAVYRRTR